MSSSYHHENIFFRSEKKVKDINLVIFTTQVKAMTMKTNKNMVIYSRAYLPIPPSTALVFPLPSLPLTLCLALSEPTQRGEIGLLLNSFDLFGTMKISWS